jgi:hypothetical protein
MRRNGIAIALALLAAFIGCGRERTKTVPDELVGIWKSSAPKYADTFIELTKTTITFGAGEAGSHVRSVVGVEKAREEGNALYTVFYVDAQGVEYKLAFYYEPGNGGVMRWKNQQSIAWTR